MVDHDRRRGYRGPIRLVKDEAEWPALLEEIEAHNSEIHEQRGSVIQGLVVALDPSKGMLDEATKRGVRLATQGLGEKLPFEDSQFDRGKPRSRFLKPP